LEIVQVLKRSKFLCSPLNISLWLICVLVASGQRLWQAWFSWCNLLTITSEFYIMF
jgi:hypothetical protein